MQYKDQLKSRPAEYSEAVEMLCHTQQDDLN